MTTRAYMGQGVTVKVSGTQKYASDCKMYAILKGLSENHYFFNGYNLLKNVYLQVIGMMI